MYYQYKTNIINTINRPVALIAPNKKTAIKFCKAFKGLKVFERCKQKHYSSLDEVTLMTKQADLLKDYLNTNKMFIITCKR